MPGTTATQRLTYPTSGDNLKDQATYLATLAKQVDARVAANASILTSQLDRPFAVIDCTVPNVISNQDSSSLVLFDTVVVDTAGLVDLSSDRRVITLNSTGYWLLGCYVKLTGSPGGSGCATNGALTVSLNADNTTPGRWSNYVKDLSLGYCTVHASGLAQVSNPALPGRCYINSSLACSSCTGCPTTFTVSTARMWAFKVREL